MGSLRPWIDKKIEICLLLTSQHVTSTLGPLLAIPYVIEKCLIPILEDLSGMNTALQSDYPQNFRHCHLLFKYLIVSLEVSLLLLTTTIYYFVN